jgi:hypothetical protein
MLGFHSISEFSISEIKVGATPPIPPVIPEEDQADGVSDAEMRKIRRKRILMRDERDWQQIINFFMKNIN